MTTSTFRRISLSFDSHSHLEKARTPKHTTIRHWWECITNVCFVLYYPCCKKIFFFQTNNLVHRNFKWQFHLFKSTTHLMQFLIVKTIHLCHVNYFVCVNGINRGWNKFVIFLQIEDKILFFYKFPNISTLHIHELNWIFSIKKITKQS